MNEYVLSTPLEGARILGIGKPKGPVMRTRTRLSITVDIARVLFGIAAIIAALHGCASLA